MSKNTEKKSKRIKSKSVCRYRYVYAYAVRKESGTIRKIYYDIFESYKELNLIKEFSSLQDIVSGSHESKKKRETDVIELLSVSLVEDKEDRKNVYSYVVYQGKIKDRKEIEVIETNYRSNSNVPLTEEMLNFLSRQDENYDDRILLGLKFVHPTNIDTEEANFDMTNGKDFYSVFGKTVEATEKDKINMESKAA